MKKTAVLLLISFALLLTSCSENVCASDVIDEFCREYPIDSLIYSSLSCSGEAGYIDGEMLRALYDIDEHPVREYALVLYGKVDTVREVGVFITENGEDEIILVDLLSKRLAFLGSFADGEGFIRRYRGVIVYGFVDNSDRAQEVFDGII